MKLKPPTLLRRRKVRSLTALAVTLAGFSGLVLSSTPALADPTQQLIAVGSDTIQDVYNQFGVDFSGNLIGSYNAVNPVTGATADITPTDGWAVKNHITPYNTTHYPTVNPNLPAGDCAFTRPNGSGQGVADLKYSLGDFTVAIPAGDAPGQGCIDIARSSSGPSGSGGFSGPGALQYIPFAQDAVTGATGPATTHSADSFVVTVGSQPITVTPTATAITLANLFTQQNLVDLYTNCLPVTVTPTTGSPVTYWPAGSATAKPGGAVTIDLYVPQSGSGTRNFWAAQLGFTADTDAHLPQCVHAQVIGGPLATTANGGQVTGTSGASVEEHDGTAVASDPNGYGPFSIAQYVAQSTGFGIDRRHDAAVQAINGVDPFASAGDPTSGMNPSFPTLFTRKVWSVVQQSRVTNSADPLFRLLNGGSSQLCNDKNTILNYGFALISNCGVVDPANTVAV